MAALPPPTPAQLAEDQGAGIIAANLTVAILATVAVFMRLLVRNSQKAGLGADDYLIALALPFGWGMCACTIIAVRHGLGKHLNTLLPYHPQQLIVEAQAYLASELIWAITIALIKISILLLYVRIFGKMRYFRHLAYGLGAFTTCWAIMVFVVCALQCRPIRLIWDKSVQGVCIDAWLFFVIGSAINTCTDFVILILPIPATWRLQMSTIQRISVIGIFSLGSVTCIFSLVRLIAVIKNNNNWDATWALGAVSIWSTAEPCLGIFAACLPPLRPLFSELFSRMASHRSGMSYPDILKKDSGGRSTGGSRSRPSRTDNFQPLQESGGTRLDTYITSARDVKTEDQQGKGIPVNAIAVETSTSWSRP